MGVLLRAREEENAPFLPPSLFPMPARPLETRVKDPRALSLRPVESPEGWQQRRSAGSRRQRGPALLSGDGGHDAQRRRPNAKAHRLWSGTARGWKCSACATHGSRVSPPPLVWKRVSQRHNPNQCTGPQLKVRAGTSVQGHGPEVDLKTMWRGMAQRKNPKQCGGA